MRSVLPILNGIQFTYNTLALYFRGTLIFSIAVQQWLEKNMLQTRLIMQVHDELVLEVPDSELELVRTRLPELMANVAKLDVPLIAETGIGANWEAAH